MTELNSELGPDTGAAVEEAERLYAKGATCDTYLVRVYGKLFLLKRLKAELAAQPRYVLAFRKEFETGFGLEHPALPKYISLQDDLNRPAIVEEYVEGLTLTEFLWQNPDYFRKSSHAHKFISQLLSVLGYLHSHQVLFLDLKPDNILITKIGRNVRLVDLGFCYTSGFNTTTGHSPGYAAPEQLRGDAVDERTDIYLVGEVLRRMDIPSTYNKVVRKCLSANPDDRYPGIDELSSAIACAERKRLLTIALGAVAAVAVLVFLFVAHPFSHREAVTVQPEKTPLATADDKAKLPRNEVTKAVADIEPATEYDTVHNDKLAPGKIRVRVIRERPVDSYDIVPEKPKVAQRDGFHIEYNPDYWALEAQPLASDGLQLVRKLGGVLYNNIKYVFRGPIEFTIIPGKDGPCSVTSKMDVSHDKNEQFDRAITEKTVISYNPTDDKNHFIKIQSYYAGAIIYVNRKH